MLDDVVADVFDRLRTMVASSRPFLLPVHALETEGMNVIPRVFARELGKLMELPVAGGVLQINRV